LGSIVFIREFKMHQAEKTDAGICGIQLIVVLQ